MRQFMQGIPDELIDAARVDGAGEFRIFATVVMPLCKPALATLAILTFLGSWNNFLWPLVVSSTEDMYTLPVALALYSVGQNSDPVRAPARRSAWSWSSRSSSCSSRCSATSSRGWRRPASRSEGLDDETPTSGRRRGRRRTRPHRRHDGLRGRPAPRRPRPDPARPCRPEALGARHVDLVRRHDGRDHGPAGRQHRRVARPGHAVRLHLADEHRRLPVVHDLRRGARDHQQARGQAAPEADADHAGDDGAPRAERHVLQLVRRGDAAPSSRSSRPARRLPVPVDRGQRVDGRGAHGGPHRRAVAAPAGGRAAGADELRRVLRRGPVRRRPARRA